jgi:hypothetical protein
MHGELFKSRCERCRVPFEDTNIYHEVPLCTCGGKIRPHIYWFGETPFGMDRVLRTLEVCTVFIAIGTSGVVEPAASFVGPTKARTFYVGPEEPLNLASFDETFTGKAGELLPNAVRRRCRVAHLIYPTVWLRKHCGYCSGAAQRYFRIMANDHQLFTVKANDGQTVRLAHFFSLYTNHMPFEVVMLGLPPEEINHPMLETGRLVWWTPNDRIYYEGVVGDKPSVIISKKANSYQFKTGDLATNEYVQIVRQRAAACPNVEDIGARGEVLFVYFDQEKYVVKALGDLVLSFSTRTEH